MEAIPETIKLLKVGDTEIEYSVGGEGEPLLLVHAGVFADWFAPLAACLALGSFHVIRVRRAGYGPNLPTSSLTIRDHASHLRDLLDFLDVKKAHVVGHSSGALIALQLAADYHHLVHSLILVEPAACGPFQAPAFTQLAERFVGPAMGAFAAGDLPGAFDSFMRGVCGNQHREVIERSLGRVGYEQAIRESRFFFQNEIPAAMQWQFGSAEAARVRQPVLIVEGATGREHGPLSQQITELACSLLAQAEVTLIAGANHMLPLQDPNALGQAIRAFTNLHPTQSMDSSHARF